MFALNASVIRYRSVWTCNKAHTESMKQNWGEICGSFHSPHYWWRSIPPALLMKIREKLNIRWTSNGFLVSKRETQSNTLYEPLNNNASSKRKRKKTWEWQNNKWGLNWQQRGWGASPELQSCCSTAARSHEHARAHTWQYQLNNKQRKWDEGDINKQCWAL